MNRGRVYLPTPGAMPGVALAEVVLPRLEAGGCLSGRHVEVRNGGMVPSDSGLPSPVGNARADAEGDFLFQPGRGGPRMDRPNISAECIRRYVETSRFAEVNTYFHVDCIAHYIHGLLADLGAKPLPKVVAVVHAHNGCLGCETIDGVRRSSGMKPLQGGHYRLPGVDHDVVEHTALSPMGEMHLGSGRRRLPQGALARRVGKTYRHNAGHNAGIIYHEYGHHIHRHTADFRGNMSRPPLEQSNRKTSMDEGTCDYWAAVMLGTPHIWCWHRRHDEAVAHRRSLTSTKTMADYDRGAEADPHKNGTIWAASLWDFRSRLDMAAPDGGRTADMIVLQALLLIGGIQKVDRPGTCQARSRFRTGLRKLVEADQLLTGGKWRDALLEAFVSRGITALRPSEVRP